MIGSNGVSNGGAVTVSGNVVTVPLTSVANGQTIAVTLGSVNGANNVTIPMRVLIADASANGSVSATDVSQTKGQTGQPITTANFRTDINANGDVNGTDISLVKSKVGTAVP